MSDDLGTLRVWTRSMLVLCKELSATLKIEHVKKTKNVMCNANFDRFAGFAREGVVTRLIKEYQYVKTKPLLPPIRQVPEVGFGMQNSLN
jgi:hypothetical protein